MALVVLGMHRSGTSCLAGMIAGGGLASAGQAVRNWDNARGHHEMLDAVRLDEAVLAHSGGHWLAPPATVAWTSDHAAERDRLLALHLDGRPALLKDPRMLLVLPFWRASALPFRAIAIVRHPLAVARSLEAWRGMPLGDGIALWLAHARALAADRARHGYPVVDFDQPRAAFVAAVVAAVGPDVDAGAYDDRLVHHDDGEPPALPELADAVALYRELGGGGEPAARRAFPRGELAEVTRLLAAGATAAAVERATCAAAAIDDAAAVVTPVVSAFVRAGAYGAARALVASAGDRLDPGLADLLAGKVLLASGDAAAALARLEAACSLPRPLFQARLLRAQALRAAGQRDRAAHAMRGVAADALYPHGPLATLAEWSRLDGDHDAALAGMAGAIAAAPLHRRGRLRTRRAEWLIERGDPGAARAELEQAMSEDPGYRRSRDVLARL